MTDRNAADSPDSVSDDRAVRQPTLLSIARAALEARVQFAKLFPRGALRDSAWDMMLELLIARETGETLCVKHVIIASQESSTSALRRIDKLQDAGLIERRLDDRDHRRIWVDLTDDGYAAMSAMLLHLTSAGDDRQPRNVAPVSFRPSGLGA